MTPTTKTKKRRRMNQKGFSIMQLIVVIAVVSVISSLAYLGITSARQRIRLTNSSRLLASYVEKARVDSVRRHPMTSDLMAGVEVLNQTTYRVKMDFDGNGTVETKDVTLDPGVVFATDPIALAFDWRGRLVDLPLTEIKVSIAMQWGSEADDQRIVDVTRSGDVTIDSDVYLDDIPNVNVNVNGLTGIDSGSTVNSNNTASPTPSPVEVEPSPSPDVIDPPPPVDDGGRNTNRRSECDSDSRLKSVAESHSEPVSQCIAECKSDSYALPDSGNHQPQSANVLEAGWWWDHKFHR